MLDHAQAARPRPLLPWCTGDGGGSRRSVVGSEAWLRPVGVVKLRLRRAGWALGRLVVAWESGTVSRVSVGAGAESGGQLCGRLGSGVVRLGCVVGHSRASTPSRVGLYLRHGQPAARQVLHRFGRRVARWPGLRSRRGPGRGLAAAGGRRRGPFPWKRIWPRAAPPRSPLWAAAGKCATLLAV